MSVNEKKSRYTIAEYFALEKNADYKSEFFKGEIFAMAGGTRDHILIGTNLARELGNATIDKDCYVFGSDLLVMVEEAEAAFYPDVTVICGKEEYAGENRIAVTNPTMIVEVLSEGTEGWDRGGKFRQYELLPSLKEYVLVEQREAQIDAYHRNAQGFWVLERFAGLDDLVQFRSLGVAIPVGGIYRGIDLSQIEQ